MNHLEAALKGKNAWWRYVVMLAVVLLASNTIGSIPMLVPIFQAMVRDPEAAAGMAANISDFSALGVTPAYGLFMMLFPFLAGLAAFIFLVKPLHERTFKTTVNGTNTFRWNRFFVAFVVWMALSFIYLFGYMKLQPSNFVLNNTSISLLYVALVAMALIPFQAGFEEVLFRGYLAQGFVSMLRYRWFPLIMTALLFALMHAFNPEVKEYGFFTMMPQYLTFGLIFGIVALMDDGIEAAIGAHAANNAFLVIMVTHESSALQTPALYEQQDILPWTEFSGLLFMGIVFIILMKVIFKWGKFSTIFGKVG